MWQVVITALFKELENNPQLVQNLIAWGMKLANDWVASAVAAQNSPKAPAAPTNLTQG